MSAKAISRAHFGVAAMFNVVLEKYREKSKPDSYSSIDYPPSWLKRELSLNIGENDTSTLEPGLDYFHTEVEASLDCEIPIIPLSTRKFKALKVIRKDPFLFIPPEEDDFLVEID